MSFIGITFLLFMLKLSDGKGFWLYRHFSYIFDIFGKMLMDLQLSLHVFDFLELQRKVLNQKDTSIFQYTDLCFHENIWQILLIFFPEFLVEHHFVVSFLRFVGF